jgi:dihydroorotate dehydrogenase (fumarate)
MTLETRYLGLALSHPFMLGASPLTGHLDNVRRIEDGGCSALVMHSLFEEDVVQATAGRFPGLERALPDFLTSGGRFIVPERFPVGPHEYVEQLRRIKEAVSIPVIGSLNGVGGDGDGWLDYARLIEQAGADALELNVYFIAAGLLDSTVDIERHIEALVRGLKQTVRIPVAVKLLPFYTAFANVAARLTAAGADGLVLFNRFYEPDIDIERPSLLFNINPSTNAELLLRLHWAAILFARVHASIAITGGVHQIADGVRALLAGANGVQMVSAILQQGPGHFREMVQGLRAWMSQHKHDSIDAFLGRASLEHTGDPAYVERESYLRMLQSWGR